MHTIHLLAVIEYVLYGTLTTGILRICSNLKYSVMISGLLDLDYSLQSLSLINVYAL